MEMTDHVQAVSSVGEEMRRLPVLFGCITATTQEPCLLQVSAVVIKVQLEVLLPDGEVKVVMAEITEGTNGQAVMELLEECYFANVDGNMEIFEE